MSKRFEELGWRETPIGEISLRRRLEPSLQIDVYEVLLGDEYLMSSLFTVAEVALADLGLAATPEDPLDVVVGGLGLGYTARAALADPRVRSLAVVEALDAVIDWHREGLLPHSAELTDDSRCRLVHGDFFALVDGGKPFWPGGPDRHHAVLLDVDHSPRHLLNDSHAPFYTSAGLSRVVDQLHPSGVFALWSDDPPDADFTNTLQQVFATATTQVVPFANHLTGGTSTNTVYVAVAPT